MPEAMLAETLSSPPRAERHSAATAGIAVGRHRALPPTRRSPTTTIAAAPRRRPHDWIASRTGVRERRVAAARRVAGRPRRRCAARSRWSAPASTAAEVDLVLVATSPPTQLLPNAAPLVAARLGAAAGRGDRRRRRLHRLRLRRSQLAAGSVESGRARSGAGDRRRADEPGPRLRRPPHRRAVRRRRRGGRRQRRAAPGRARAVSGCTPTAAAAELITVSHDERKVRDGRARHLPPGGRPPAEVDPARSATTPGSSLDEIDLFVYHQANSRILAAVGERLGLARDRVVDSHRRFGNTSAATIPIALDEALAGGPARRRRPGSCSARSAPGSPGAPGSSSGAGRD